MHKYVETDDDDDGFEGTGNFGNPIGHRKSQQLLSQRLSRHVESVDEDFIDDFNDLTFTKGGTMKKKPSAMSFSRNGTIKLASTRSQDPNRTLSARPSEFESTPTLGDSDFEDGFDGIDKGVTFKTRFAPYPSDGHLSESDTAARMSVSSSTSSLSSLDNPVDDADFLWDESDNKQPETLQERFQARERRARLQDLKDFAAPSPVRLPPAKVWGNGLSEEEGENLTRGIDLNSLDFKRGTVNKNVIFGYKQQLEQLEQQRNEVTSHMADINRRLRNVQSIAQLQDVKSDRLRPAKSMYELPSQRLSRRAADAKRQELRPLTQYVEPEKPVAPRKSRSKGEQSGKAGLHERRKRKIGLIRNPATNGILQSNELNGMIFNSAAGQWEGNEADIRKFDNALAKRPVLISQASAAAAAKLRSVNGGMAFDKKNLCWVQQDGAEDDPDPFAGIDELDVVTPSLRDPSFGSSIGRGETAEQETFVVSRETRTRWRKNDERFIRKFGRWIGRGDVDPSPAYDIYRMVYD